MTNSLSHWALVYCFSRPYEKGIATANASVGILLTSMSEKIRPNEKGIATSSLATDPDGEAKLHRMT
jgi:hypothetical protein